MPIAGDCVVTAGTTMLGGRDSSGGLIVRANTGQLILGNDDPSFDHALGRATYTFAASTLIENGVLYVRQHNTLRSNVSVKPHEHSRLLVAGTLEGDLSNSGFVGLSHTGAINGNVVNEGGITLWGGVVNGTLFNSGKLYVSSWIYDKGRDPRVTSDFTQSASGELAIDLPPSGLQGDFSGVLLVQGRAFLAGLLTLGVYTDDWGPYPLPAAGSHWLIRAEGGVFGTFSRWTSPFLFMEGSLRYGSNDVWFDLTRVSMAPAMASNGIGSPLTLASAANLDRAFARTDGFALAPPGSLTSAQDRMLTSAGFVLRIGDVAQATRTLDSLSGAIHGDAMQSSLRQGLADAAVDQRLALMHPGIAAGAWSKTGANRGVSGFDQWLSPRLLVGVQAGQGSDNARDTFGQSRRLSPQAGAYLRWFGNHGWYAGGSAGYAQHSFLLDRTLDLGRGGQWNAHSIHRFNVAGVQGEAGRRLSFAGGTLTPYVALDATAVRSERTIELGRTGFELALQPAMQAQLGGSLGLRFGRDWRLGDTGWLRLDADARMQRRLADAGDPLQAAFVGVPDLWFDLPVHANRTHGWLDLGLRGGFGRDWSWSFDRSRPLAGGRTGADAWRIGLLRTF